MPTSYNFVSFFFFNTGSVPFKLHYNLANVNHTHLLVSVETKKEPPSLGHREYVLAKKEYEQIKYNKLNLTKQYNNHTCRLRPLRNLVLFKNESLDMG